MSSTDAHTHSKRPATPLAGPYGHPLHPTVVTIPIGAWTAAIVFDIIALADGDAGFARGATVLVVIGLVGAVVAAVLGLLDLTRIEPGTVARRKALAHMGLNLGVVALFAVGLVLRLTAEAVSVAGFVVSLIALALLGVSGWLGGELVFRYGVRVADEGTQGEGFRAS